MKIIIVKKHSNILEYDKTYDSPVLTGSLEEILKSKYRSHVLLTFVEAKYLGFPTEELSGCNDLSFGRGFEFDPMNMYGLYWRRTPWRNITVGPEYNQLTINTEIWLRIIPWIIFKWQFSRVISNKRIEELISQSVHSS